MADLHELFVDELDTPQAGRLEQLDLRLDQQVECHFGHKQAGPGTRRISDSRANVRNGEVVRRVDRLQGVAKHVVEDVVDTCAARQLFGRDLERGAVDGRDKVLGELGHELEDERAAVLFTQESRVAKGVELLLRLTHQGVQPRLHIWQLLPDVVHQDLGSWSARGSNV